MLEARLHAGLRAPPLAQPQSRCRLSLTHHVRCMASKPPEEKSWIELAGRSPCCVQRVGHCNTYFALN